jgi:hypothetical protein
MASGLTALVSWFTLRKLCRIRVKNWKHQRAQDINAFTEPALSAEEWTIKGGN